MSIFVKYRCCFSNNLEMLILVTRLIKVKLVPALFTDFSVANNPTFSERRYPRMLYLTNLPFMQMSVEEKTTFDKRLIN